MTEARHAKFNDTVCHLEPNVKEGPGGLRDLQTVEWLAKLRESAPETDIAVERSREFLWNLRCQLHASAGRDHNVLSFDTQEQLSPDPAGAMREYYRHARVAFRASLRAVETCESLFSNGLIRSFRDWRSRLSNSEFSVVRDRVMLRSPQQMTVDTTVLFRLFEFVGRHGIPLSFDTERRVREAMSTGQSMLPEASAMWPLLRSVLSQPNAALALHGMQETGLLTAVLPAWETIDCLVLRDFYHRYTVDEHTLIAVGHLDSLRTETDPARRRFAEMLTETQDMPILISAVLLHDIGKSDGLSGHAHASALEAVGNLRRIGVPEDEIETITFLIEHHLDLSAVMNSRDLNDPATGVELANRVETLEKLRYLTLLTYADISAVNPDSMTPWRLEQLWHTYLTGHRELTRELDTGRIHVTEADNGKAEWLEGFPTRYVRTHTPAQIEGHMKLAQQARKEGVALEIVHRGSAWHLTVVASDRSGLLAGLTGAVSSFGMNIVRAEAFSNTSGLILDAIVFEDPMRALGT